MIDYNELYELLRKEKYSDVLQPLPKDFVKDVSEFLNDKKEESAKEEGFFQDKLVRSKKQLENSIAIFRELILRRKRKLLHLVFVATETGIMKRDYENMLPFEKEVFDNLVKSFEEGDKVLARLIEGKGEEMKTTKTMVIFKQNVEQFVDLSGSIVGPFSSGELAHLDKGVSEILVADGKARYVDE